MSYLSDEIDHRHRVERELLALRNRLAELVGYYGTQGAVPVEKLRELLDKTTTN